MEDLFFEESVSGNEYFSVSSPLPDIPANADKSSVKETLERFANENNFSLSICKSGKNVLHLRCVHGGSYHNWRKDLNEETRERVRGTTKTGCPYKIRLSVKKGEEGFNYYANRKADQKESFHNHPLDEANLRLSRRGRISLLDEQNHRKVDEGIKLNFPSRLIQDSISQDSEVNKLTIHDINNLKYASQLRMGLKSEDGALSLIKYIEGKGFDVKYRESYEGYLDELFFTNKSTVMRTIKFPEVIAMDATYLTNDLKMPFICAYGVSNLGGMRLKTFPIAFAWVSSEMAYMYQWFLECMKETFGDVLENTVFVTDKCAALTGELDIVFKNNKRLLCTWHMLNNLDEKCTNKTFVSTKHSKQFKSYVITMIRTEDDVECFTNRDLCHKFLNDPNNFVNNEQRESFKRYFNCEWDQQIDRWTGAASSKLRNLGCTTTQRAESGHRVLKKGMSVTQPLNRAFDCLVKNLESFERDYRQLEAKEANVIDVRILGEKRLKNLFRKISHRALVAIYEELSLEGSLDDTCCCHNRVVYGLPCSHQLHRIQYRNLILSDVDVRWHLNTAADVLSNKDNQSNDDAEYEDIQDEEIDEEEAQMETENLLEVNPWAKHLLAIEEAFITCENDEEKTRSLIGAIQTVVDYKKECLGLLNTTKVKKTLRLPVPSEVRKPGRPRKNHRLSRLKKDFCKC